MDASIRSGVYPTMITPYCDDGTLDFGGVDALVEYYRKSGCDGIFAVCQSSEIFFLSDEEKRSLMRRVKAAAGSGMQLVASGHTADDIDSGIRQLAGMAECGADASVIILNRLAKADESEDEVKRNLDKILKALPDLLFGVYECPYPYKRLASPELMRHFADTGRVVFVKDTCCRVEGLAVKQKAVEGTNLKIFNANTATLYESLKLGIEGYSGIMANFHADLYVKFFELFRAGDPLEHELHSFLTLAALIENQPYPINAKYCRRLRGTPIGLFTRSRDMAAWNPTCELEVKALCEMEDRWRERLGM
jgi:4-hydroxy-tetrahydrodipicolinate synthase